MKPIFLAVLLLGAAPAAAAATYEVDADEDGCWTAPSRCIKATAKWSKDEKDKLVITYRNVCQHRIYVHFCSERKNGRKDCGAGGIEGGRSATWSTHNANGKYNWKLVGALNRAKDRVCAGKVRDWND